MTRPAFVPDFNAAFQPYPDVWTATIGGNNLECYIVKDSLTIRIGKNEPFPVGQADTGTASFDIIGEPQRWQSHSLPFAVNAYTGAWTDAPGGTSTVQPRGVIYRAPAGDWTKNQVRGKTFTAMMETDHPAGWYPAFGQRRPFTGGDVTVDVRDEANIPMDIDDTVARMVVRYYTANPWHGGGVLVDEAYGPWTPPDGTSNTFLVTMPGGAVDSRARYAQWGVNVLIGQGLSFGNFVRTVTLDCPTSGWDYSLDTSVVDTFEAGEKVAIQRNGTPVWTGWVTDEERSWSPSTGSISKVNAAGPRRFHQNAIYAPAGSEYNYAMDGVSFFRFPQNARASYELIEYATVLDPLLRAPGTPGLGAQDAGMWAGADGGPGATPIGQLWYAKGSQELPKPLWILDAAANTILGSVWEGRNGALRVIGPKYYSYAATQNPTPAETIVLNCDDIDAPVTLRKDAGLRFTRWVQHNGPTLIGHNPSDTLTAGAGIGEETFTDDPAIAKYGPLDYRPDPVLGSGAAGPGNPALWNNLVLKIARAADIEQVDAWAIHKDRVTDATWQRLLTAELGWPIHVTNLPAGLFLDGRTTFVGYMWGWQMTGTETINLTLIDARVFTG